MDADRHETHNAATVPTLAVAGDCDPPGATGPAGTGRDALRASEAAGPAALPAPAVAGDCDPPALGHAVEGRDALRASASPERDTRPSALRHFRELRHRNPALALLVLGLFALAVETAQKVEEEGASPPFQAELISVAPDWELPALQSAVLPEALSPSLSPEGSAALLEAYGPPLTNRWDALAQDLLGRYGDTDGDGLSDAEERCGLALYDTAGNEPLHAFGPGARALDFPTPADREVRLLGLPSGFPLGGTVHTQAFVHVDGTLGLGHPALPGRPGELPFPSGHPAALLAPLWADLAHHPATSRLWSLPLADPATGATNALAVAWEGLRVGTNAGSSASFQAELHASGLVRFLHGPVTGVPGTGPVAVTGVQFPGAWSSGSPPPATEGWSAVATLGGHVPGRAFRLWSAQGFDPALRDSDGDGTEDGVEWRYSLPRPDGLAFSRSVACPDPPDFDNDGLPNREEYDLGLDALWYDTDGDALPDAWERASGLDPRSAAGPDGADADPDGDGRTNLREFQDQTRPLVPDAEPGVPSGTATAWATLAVDTDPQFPGEVHLATLRGLGSESNRCLALHNHGGTARTLRVPLSDHADYRVGIRSHNPAGARGENVPWRSDVRLAADAGVCLGVFDAQGVFDATADGFGGERFWGDPPGGRPAGVPDGEAIVRVCCATGRVHTAILAGAGGHLVFDPLNTLTNLGPATLADPPRCEGQRVDWAAETPEGQPAPGILLGSPSEGSNTTILVDASVASLTNRLGATSEKNCRVGDGTLTLDSVVKITLVVSNGTYATYLPGYDGDQPVIKWDKEGNRLIAQRLQVRVETLGTGYTNAVVKIATTTSLPGWCTNTREPNKDDPEKIRTQWFPQDFSLSETEYVNQVHLPLGGDPDGTVTAADLFCRDYGGACRIRVELAGLGGAPPVTREFKVPRDTDNDDIADCWEEAVKAEWESTFGTNIAEAATGFVGRSKPTEPRDPDGDGLLAAHSGEGDGLNAADEYRGFSLPGTGSTGGTPHFRLSTAWKDMVFQVDVAETNGVAVLSPGVAGSFAGFVASVLLRDLGIRVHWHLAAPHDSAQHSGAYAKALAASYSDNFGSSLAPLHARKGMRRLVFLAGMPPDETRGPVLGNAHARAALVDVAASREIPGGGTAWGAFLMASQVSPDDMCRNIAVHEAGHLAGCRGDRTIYSDSPVLSVYGSGGIDGQEYYAGVSNAPHQAYLLLGRKEYGPDAAIPFHGQVNLTVGQLASAIAALDRYGALTHGDAAVSARPAGALDIGAGIRFGNGVGGATGLRAEAELNGVMSYNHVNPTLWKAPAFDNGAAAIPSGPRARLYPLEVGGVWFYNMGD